MAAGEEEIESSLSSLIICLSTYICLALEALLKKAGTIRDWYISLKRGSKNNRTFVFKKEFFKPLACLLIAKKVYAKCCIGSCISVNDYLKGPSFTSFAANNKFSRWYPPQLGVIKNQF